MDAAIKITGAKEIRTAFKELAGKEGTKALASANKRVGVVVARKAQSAAGSGTKLQAKMAGAIGPRSSATSAGLAVRRTGAFLAAGAAFWGVKNRLGWFAAAKYAAYTVASQKLPEWVGSSWTSGVKGQGPHRINDAVADSVDDAIREYERAMDEAASRVGLV